MVGLGLGNRFGRMGAITHKTSGAPPPTPFWTLPTPPASGLAFWSDYKTNSNFFFKDATLGLNTFNTMEDMTGNGYGFLQPYRTDGVNPRQPSVGALSGAPYFTGTQWLQCAAGDIFAGQAIVTLGFAFSIDSTFTAVANRTIFDNGFSSASQINIGLVGTGGNARKLRVNIRPNAAGTQYVSATTGSVVSNDAKHTVVVEMNITSGSVAINIYLDGSAYLTGQTFVPSTNVFTTLATIVPGTGIALGNDASTQGTPLGGEVLGALGYLGAFDSTKRAAITTYLASL